MAEIVCSFGLEAEDFVLQFRSVLLTQPFKEELGRSPAQFAYGLAHHPEARVQQGGELGVVEVNYRLIPRDLETCRSRVRSTPMVVRRLPVRKSVGRCSVRSVRPRRVRRASRLTRRGNRFRSSVIGAGRVRTRDLSKLMWRADERTRTANLLITSELFLRDDSLLHST